MAKPFRLLGFFLLALILLGCELLGSGSQTVDPDDTETDTGSSLTMPKFNYIALGDSLTMGVQDGTANHFTQPYSYAVFVAKQVSKTYGTGLTMPLLDVDGARKNPDYVPTILGVSGEDSASLSGTKASATEAPAAGDPLHERVLFPLADADHHNAETSQLDAAIWLAQSWKDSDASIPKIITLWIGNNDVLGAVLKKGDENYTAAAINEAMTSPEDFKANLEPAFAALAETGAKVFVGNIPDIPQVAYLVAPSTVKAWTGKTIPTAKVPAGAKISLPAALYLYDDFLKDKDWEDSMDQRLNDASVMTTEEAQLIRDRVQALNAALAELAEAKEFTLVDFHGQLTSPMNIGAQTYTNEWGKGGFFSLDGIHFSHSGHAIAANLWIQAINAKLGSSIEEIPVNEVRLGDPYADRDGDGFPAGQSYEPKEQLVQLLFQFRDADDSDPNVGIKGAE
ncbi:MAG TPA: SGNH/GDSL hydrolase family protein [bacterium]|nr:SGNH/GDSL hydrolase family protein [bacterium]